jgi:hypothetical protein
MVPFAKTGGVAEVANALPRALRELGHDVRVAMPRYGRIEPSKLDIRTLIPEMSVPMDDRTETATIMSTETENGLPVYFVDNARYFKGRLRDLGFDIGQSETPITPVIVGQGELAMKLSDRLFEEGVFAQGIGYPTVPEARSRVRTIVTAAHTRENLDTAIAIFEKVGRELGII